MKTIEQLKAELKEALSECVHINDGSLAAQVDENIQWAWENWNDEIIKDFYKGEKPEGYTPEFRDHWIDNEDFYDALERINEDSLTYDVYFNDETDSNNKGFECTFEDAKAYIDAYNGTNESYFEDYKGGTVSVVCNETEETVFETKIK